MESENAVRVFGDGSDDFPVLKAFQQYIDAEQNKARKRMVTLSVFFGVLMALVVTLFLFLLSQVSARNEVLNDKLLDYMMRKDDDRRAASVVVQPSADNATVQSLSAKLETMQKALEESRKENAALDQARREKLEQERRDLERKKFDEELELERLKFKSEVEKLKTELEKSRVASELESEKKRQQELEAYRRKHYPEYYKAKASTPVKAATAVQPTETEEEIDALLDNLSLEPIQYFDEPSSPSAATPSAATPAYDIPVEVKGTRRKWRIPTT